MNEVAVNQPDYETQRRIEREIEQLQDLGTPRKEEIRCDETGFDLRPPVFLLLLRLSRSRRLSVLWRFVEENYGNTDLTLATAARACAMSENNLNLLLRKQIHCTFHALLVRYRLLMSLRPLNETDDTVLEIALANGFGSLATFEKQFKRFLGVPPRKWRKQDSGGYGNS